jgi:hypothetical protein
MPIIRRSKPEPEPLLRLLVADYLDKTADDPKIPDCMQFVFSCTAASMRRQCRKEMSQIRFEAELEQAEALYRNIFESKEIDPLSCLMQDLPWWPDNDEPEDTEQ